MRHCFHSSMQYLLFRPHKKTQVHASKQNFEIPFTGLLRYLPKILRDKKSLFVMNYWSYLIQTT